jgi:hypothetical protein
MGMGKKSRNENMQQNLTSCVLLHLSAKTGVLLHLSAKTQPWELAAELTCAPATPDSKSEEKGGAALLLAMEMARA